jgi:ceramide glucosyltransferase
VTRLLLTGICVAAATYQVLAIGASILHLRRRRGTPSVPNGVLPGVSILKPIYGADPHFYQAIRTHAELRYPRFEVLFGVRRSDDPALPHIEQLQREYPRVAVRLIRSETEAANGKVAVLEDLARAASYPILVVNDSDISVAPHYLNQLVAELSQPQTGLVTCLYRAEADSWPARMEALGIATDFAPSATLAPRLGVNEFGMGSTLAFRAEDVERSGGFAALRDFIADDYQLGKNISALGLEVRLSTMPVSTYLSGDTWREVWEHQVRWARTIRVSRSGYFGLPLTHATVWALLAALSGRRRLALALLLLRVASGLTSGVLVLGDPLTARYWWLMPVRDLWGAAIWVAGAFGHTVLWRGRRLRLDSSGRIAEAQETVSS